MVTKAKLSQEQIEKYLRRCNDVALRAVSFGKHPFGSILLAPDLETVLIEQANIDVVDHAEAVLARSAHKNFSPEYLWECTLFTSVEPCCMCTGTIYWANIGSIVYGISEEQLLQITGNNKDNPTLRVPCKFVLEHGQKDIKVMGPVSELSDELAEVHKRFWHSV